MKWITLLLFVLFSFNVFANDCSDEVCIEYGTICEPYEDQNYLDCIAENEDGDNTYRSCSQSEKCEMGCVKYECLENNNEDIEMSVSSDGSIHVSSKSLPEERVESSNDTEPEQNIDMSSAQKCTRCPPACEYIEDNECGICNCPDNLGKCSSTGLRDFINNTNAYCNGGLWFEQKLDNETCQNSFECETNFCSKGVCYDISTQVKENKGLLNKILEFLFGWMSKDYIELQ